MPDYKDGKIYMIWSPKTDKVYIGSIPAIEQARVAVVAGVAHFVEVFLLVRTGWVHVFDTVPKGVNGVIVAECFNLVFHRRVRLRMLCRVRFHLDALESRGKRRKEKLRAV